MADDHDDAEDPTNDDYEVGYGKSPEGSHWPKGVSGNPRGRPKNARGLKTDLREELASKMVIRMNGEKVSGTRQRLMLRTLTARAASGDVRATKLLVDLVMQVFGPEDHIAGAERMSAQDQAILDQLLVRRTPQKPDTPLPAEGFGPAIASDLASRQPFRVSRFDRT